MPLYSLLRSRCFKINSHCIPPRSGEKGQILVSCMQQQSFKKNTWTLRVQYTSSTRVSCHGSCPPVPHQYFFWGQKETQEHIDGEPDTSSFHKLSKITTVGRPHPSPFGSLLTTFTKSDPQHQCCTIVCSDTQFLRLDFACPKRAVSTGSREKNRQTLDSIMALEGVHLT